MSDAPLQTTLPRQVDPRKFAQKGISLSGRVPLVQMPRLNEAVQSGAEEVDVHLEFGVDQQRAKTLKGHAKASVSVISAQLGLPRGHSWHRPAPQSAALSL